MDLNKIFIKNCRPTKVGGQAILEGLMMRGSRAIAVAIREPSGNIHLSVEPLAAPGKWKKIPIVRGVISFVDSLVSGTRILMEGAEILEKLESETPAPSQTASGSAPSQTASGSAQCETASGAAPSQTASGSSSSSEDPLPGEDKFEKWLNEKFGKEKAFSILLYASAVLAIIISLAFFVLLPTALLSLVKKAGIESPFLLNLFEGILRIIMFVCYVLAISKTPDIKRVFQYHGAEHKTIHCYENGLELTPENAQTFYTLHPRCGTSFLMFVMIISLLVFSFLGWPSLAVRLLTRLLLIPVIAGISYEVLQFTGRHDSRFVQILSLPGIALQKLTTAEPDLAMLEVAIAAVKAVLPSHENPELPVETWVGEQLADGTLVKNEEETLALIAKRAKE